MFKTSNFSILIWVLFFCLFQNLFADSSLNPASNGFKITKDALLHVGLTLIPEYESNITKASEDTKSNGVKTDIVSDLILHYSPSLRIKLDDKSKTVGFSILFDYNHYLGLENKKASSKLSDLDVKSEFLGEFNKDGSVNFDFKNVLLRSTTPEGQEISEKHKNILNNFTLGVGFKNIEDVLYGKIQAGVGVNYLEQSKDSPVYKDYNYVSALIDFFGRWKFLPRTMAFTKAAFRYQDYYESAVRDYSRSMPFDLLVGLMGQISPYISTKISAGYSANFGKSIKNDYNANAELIFKYNDITFMNLGYLRNMRPAAYYQYYATHNLYFNLKQKITKYVLASLAFKYFYISYGEHIEYRDRDGYQDNKDGTYETLDPDPAAPTNLKIVVETPKGDRFDHLILFEPAFSFNILSWLGLKLSYNLEYRKSDYFKKSTYTYSNNEDSSKNYVRTYETHYDFIDHRVLLSIVLDY